MSARLESFQWIPAAVDGWETPELPFGALFTAVQGPNGSGKTPVMKGVMVALGHEIDLPPEIRAHCAWARLRISVDGHPITLTRRTPLSRTDFFLTVDDGEEIEEFSEAPRFAEWFVNLLGGAQRKLTERGGKPTELYANLILPSFWVDQDNGWTTAYFVPPDRNFIRDQRQEVIRFLTGLPPRHPFLDKSEFDQAKDDLEKADKDVELQRYAVDNLRNGLRIVDGEEALLLERQTALDAELTANSQTIEAVRDLTVFYDRSIAKFEQEKAELKVRHDALTRRRGQLNLALAELGGEVEILGANVEAAELLREFCTRQGCEMFASSEQSYGRSLLYLKDQIKDIEAADQGLGGDASAIKKEMDEIDAEIEAVRAERTAALEASPQAQLSKRLDALTANTVEVKLRLAGYKQYNTERLKFERSIDRREQALKRVAELRPRGARGDSDPIEDVRRQLSESMQRWLAALSTPNTREAAFSDDFRLYIDGQEFSIVSHQSGSTRTRIVLAFHAALLEVALDRGGNHPGWLLFDAPKQHELDQSHFDVYVERLKQLSDKYPGRVQMVFSVADLKTQIESTDEIWEPSYRNAEGKPRFLGPAAKPLETLTAKP
jgi:hypothetical protein